MIAQHLPVNIMRNINPASGSVSIDNIGVYTRDGAGKVLNPPVTGKQVKRYLDLLAIFSDNFADFKDPKTGHLNGEPITEWHIPELQRIREYFATYRKKGRVQVELKRYYDRQQFN